MAKVVGWFLVAVGVSILALWVMLLLTGVPEVEEGRVDIWFHIAAELILATLLITAGWSVRRASPRAGLLTGMAFGALVYSVVNSAGYYAQSAEWIWIALFGLLLAVAGAVLGQWWGFFGVKRASAPRHDPDRERLPV